MDLVTSQACPVCQATFPESWKRPVHCNHKHPGRNWSMRSQPRAEVKHELSHWTALHQYAVDHASSWNTDAAISWFASWTSRIPNYGCACQKNFAAYCEQTPPDFSSADAFFVWTVAAHNYVSLNHVQPRKLPMTVEDARQRYRMPTRRGLVQHFISWDEFTADTLALTQQILERFPDVAGIAGCPRSGMRAAADIAVRLGIPLYEASAKNGLRKLAGGLRLEGKMFSDSPLVVVEDSACTGQSVARLSSHEDLQSLPVYAVYATQQASKLLNGYAVAIEPPHWFDWHFFHCRELLKQHAVGIDWDGVLNTDCPQECDDDGQRYREWLDAVRPVRRPDWIPTIITARLEAYRDQCLQWLARYRIECDQLIMFPGSFAERAKANLGLWKASMCDEHGVEMFVESDLMQAQTIAVKRNKLTLSIEKPQ